MTQPCRADPRIAGANRRQHPCYSRRRADWSGRTLPPAEEARALEQNVLDERARPVETRFELAAWRMVEPWLEAGRVRVSACGGRLDRRVHEHTGTRGRDVRGA